MLLTLIQHVLHILVLFRKKSLKQVNKQVDKSLETEPRLVKSDYYHMQIEY